MEIHLIRTCAFPAKHFTSWHGLFGLITSILLVVQALIGALLAYKPGFDLFGSEEKAKSFWKYHRARPLYHGQHKYSS
jgi:hypothetical protein